MTVIVERATLAQDLWDYGEDELAVRALELSDEELSRVQFLAGEFATSDEFATPSGSGMLVARACALAAVEVIEGVRRPLKRKRRRSVPRLPHPAPLTDEVPREVFAAAAADVAERFAPLGFRFAKSGPHVSRQREEFTEQILFLRGHGGFGFEVTALVRSAALKRWRATERPDGSASDIVAGGLLENLAVDTPRASWNLADPDRRPALLDEITAAIVSVVLPYFDLFEDGDELVGRLSRAEVPSCSPCGAVEWLLSKGEHGAAVQHARTVLRDDTLREQYARYRAAMEAGEMKLVPWVERGGGLAYAVLAHDLGDEVGPS